MFRTSSITVKNNGDICFIYLGGALSHSTHYIQLYPNKIPISRLCQLSSWDVIYQSKGKRGSALNSQTQKERYQNKKHGYSLPWYNDWQQTQWQLQRKDSAQKVRQMQALRCPSLTIMSMVTISNMKKATKTCLWVNIVEPMFYNCG